MLLKINQFTAVVYGNFVESNKVKNKLKNKLYLYNIIDGCKYYR
jgi:hypothetical protein